MPYKGAFDWKVSGIAYVLGSTLIYGVYSLGLPTFPFFLALFGVTALIHRPRFALSPLTVLYLYYAAWFVAAPAFAEIYKGDLGLPEYNLAFAFAYSTLGLAAMAIQWGESIALRQPSLPSWFNRLPAAPSDKALYIIIALLYALASAAVAMIVLRSGGIERWMANPGAAFLARGGTGAFVILSHFSSLALAAISGYVAFRNRNYWPVAIFLVWLSATFPVHGSKLQIALLITMVLSPWIFRARFLSWITAALVAGGGAVFLGGMLLRHHNLLSSWEKVVSTLNYFTALENLAMSVRDLAPGFLQTFFMPFNKIGMLLGLVPADSYFDMNHYLTDLYYPGKWARRATEQWPVETDMYLNFFFVGGLPIVFLFFAAHGYLFGLAKRLNSMGSLFAVTMITIGMISHLRGSIYNHVDFYLYPYILLMFLLMLNWNIQTKTESA